MTISATTAMTTISEKPMSNMVTAAQVAASCVLRLRRVPLHFRVDRLAGDLRRWRGVGGRRRGFFRGLHAFLESLHGAAQVLPDVAQLLRTEDEDDDEKYDEP